MKITFLSGRIASLVELTQSLSYAGLLAGLPNSRINQRQIDDLIKEGRRIHIGGREPVLIEPNVKTIEHTRSGQPVQELRLPDICCAARFESGALLRANSEPYSSLVVVWFQMNLRCRLLPTSGNRWLKLNGKKTRWIGVGNEGNDSVRKAYSRKFAGRFAIPICYARAQI